MEEAGFFFLFTNKTIVSYQTSLSAVRLQVLLDWLALLMFIHFTGGIFSPLVFFVILHVIINAMIFPPYQCYIYAAVSLMGLGALVLLEDVFRYFPVSNLWLGKMPPALDPVSLLISFFLFSLVLFCATFLATSFMARLRERENDVRLLTRKLQKALTRMETLYEATKAMVSSYDLTAVLDRIVQDSVRMTGAQGAVLHLLREGKIELTPAAACGLSEAFLKKGPVKRDDGLTPKNPEDVIIVDDVEHDSRLNYPREIKEEGIHSIISIPLASKGHIKGDLRLYSTTRHHFTDDEISFLKILAGGAAVIIDSAQAWEALEESNKKIISFAYKIGHDLKAPVVAIQGLLSAMQEGYAGDVPPRQKDILARCIKKQEQLLLLIRDLLNLAEGQIPTGGQKIIPIQVESVAAESVKLLEAVARRKEITIVYAPPGHAITFQEVPGDFQRLFSNVLDNAVRYTPSGGMVELELGSDDEKISLRVRDTGIGIDPEYKEKIFDEFFRTPQAKKCLADGTGLGLSIVKGIVQRYRGTIQVESEPGKGTMFFITFPRK